MGITPPIFLAGSIIIRMLDDKKSPSVQKTLLKRNILHQ